MKLTPELIERIKRNPNLFLLDGVVQFKYVQGTTEPNDTNFGVYMAGGHTMRGDPSDFYKFWDKYLSYLESKK
jgi:hypothetical protein